MIPAFYGSKMDEEPISYNFNKICRFCLAQGGIMSAIFDEDVQENSVPLPFKIMACVHIQVSAEDGLPALVCRTCRHQFERSYQFKQQCQLSDSTLRRCINKRRIDSIQVDVKQEESENQDLPITVEGNSRPGMTLDTDTPSRRKRSGIQTHKCDRCGRAFAKRRELSRHLLVHTGERPHPCPVCPKRFSRRDKLARHIKIHGRRHSHNCLQCPATFQHKDELVLHQMNHTEDGASTCPACYKTYGTKAELNRHARTHAKIKPFRCDLCGLAFCRRDKLSRHQQVHSKSSLPGGSNRREEDAASMSLSRLGQNPEILLFPIPRQ